jgi:hypothetical protein
MNKTTTGTRKGIKPISAVLLATMLWTFCGVGSALAGWDDQSDELPGMDNDMTPVLIAGGVLLGLAIILKMKSSKGDQEETADQETETGIGEDGEDGSDLFSDESDYLARTESSDLETVSAPRIQPLAGIGKSGACVGLSLGF